MKKVLLLTVAMVFAATAASAQIGTIGIFADNGCSECAVFQGAQFSTTTLYVCHENTGGAKASQWSAVKPACWSAVSTGDVPVFAVTQGTSQTEVSIGYGVCTAGTFHILTMNFLVVGPLPTDACCEYGVGPAPSIAQVLAVDCTDTEVPSASGSTVTIDPDATCECGVVPTEESTWGSVKALYNN